MASEDVKVISLWDNRRYGTVFPQLPLILENDLFLPCCCYEVFLPVAPVVSEINMFEEAVLRLQCIGSFSYVELAEALCLPTDLITFVLARLKENGLLDEQGQVTDRGCGTLESDKDLDVAPFYLLAAADTLAVLPYLFSKSAVQHGIREGGIVRLALGSKGRSKEIKGRHLFVDHKNRHVPNTLEQKTLKNAVRVYNRRTEKPVYLQSGWHIVSSYAGRRYLHVKAALQDGNVDSLLASDGTAPASADLAQYLLSLPMQPDLLTQLKQQAAQAGSRQEQRTRIAGGRYPELRRHLWIKAAETQAVNTDERERTRQKEAFTVLSLLQAVEWALFYHWQRHPLDVATLFVLKKAGATENEETLLGFANSLHIQNLQGRRIFSGVTGNAIDKLKSGNDPSLEVLLPLTVAAAARDHESRFLFVLDEMPDVIAFLACLRQYGQEIRHSGKWQPRKNDDTTDALQSKVKKIVQLLLPDFTLDTQDQTSAQSSASLEKINAEIALMQVLGDAYLRMLPDLQRQLRLVSPDKQELPEPFRLVQILSSILEISLQQCLMALPQECPVRTQIETLQLLQTRYGVVPAGLDYVSSAYFDSAVRRHPATLGAYCLAFLSLSDDTVWQELLAVHLPRLIAEVASARGHGNNVALKMSGDECRSLRDRVLAMVKVLEARR